MIILESHDARSEEQQSRLAGRTRSIKLRYRIDADDVPFAQSRAARAPNRLCEASLNHVGRCVGQSSVLRRQRGRHATTPFSRMNHSTAARLRKRFLPVCGEAY